MKFYLIAGANGSGKTTLAKELLGSIPELFFLNADETAKEINDGFGLRAGKITLQRLDHLLRENRSIVMESTIAGQHHFRILKKAKAQGYEIYFIYVYLDLIEMNVSRVKNRVLLGGHNVPEADIYRRAQRSWKNFKQTREAVDKWEVYHNVDHTYEKIALGNDDENIINQHTYSNFKELIKCGH